MDFNKQDRDGKPPNPQTPKHEKTLASICKLLIEIERIESTTGPSKRTSRLHAEIDKLREAINLQEQSD